MDDTFEDFNRVLSITGIRIYAKTNYNSKIWLSLQIFNCIIGVFCFIFTTGFIITNYADSYAFIQGACIWTTGVIMAISFGICLVFRNRFREFILEMVFTDGLMTMPLINVACNLDNGNLLYQLKELVYMTQNKLVNWTRILLKIYVSCVWVVTTQYLCTCIYQMMIAEDESLRLIPFDMWFPWSLEDWGVYVMSFILDSYSGFLVGVAYPGLQLTIALLVGQILRHLQILSFILSNFNDLVVELAKDRNDSWQEVSTSVLCQCVDHYIRLKRFSNRLNVICRPFYLTLILVAIMLVCTCSVKIAISDKLTADTMKYYVHESVFIFVVLLFCYLGQRVDNECERLGEIVTDNWFLYDKKHKTNIKIFKLALDQRMPIYIFGSVTLSLPTFTWFLKTVMSFFTLVMSVLDN